MEKGLVIRRGRHYFFGSGSRLNPRHSRFLGFWLMRRHSVRKVLRTMNLRVLLAAAVAATAMGGSLALADTAIAVNGNDLGKKIVAANGDSNITAIRCATPKGCDRGWALPTYTGTQRLVINGRGSTIDATGKTNRDVFSSTGGGKVKLTNIKLLGGMSGIYVEVPAGQTSTALVELKSVLVKGAALHGIHIVDGNAAKASIRLDMAKTKVFENGLGGLDQDGVLVEETGGGKVLITVTDSFVNDNAGDGFGVNESGAGDVKVTIAGSVFLSNGANPNNPGNPEDGLDIDEENAGNLIMTVTDSRFNLNRDDGVDVDEHDGGSIDIDMTAVKMVKNKDQGLAFTERFVGDATVVLTDSQATGNDAGSQEINIRAEQLDAGTGDLTLDNTVASKISRIGVTVTRLP